MPSLILDLLNFNKTVDYSVIIPLVIIYVLVFWLIVCGWVAFDANKRLHSRIKGVFLGLGALIFGVPFLILYLLIRPMDEDLYVQSEVEPQGGVNVPVVNFVGPDGVVMSLELRINSQKMAQEKASEMKIDVSFDSLDENKKVSTPATVDVNSNKPEIVITQTVSGNKLSGISSRLKGGINNFTKALSGAIKSKKKSVVKSANNNEPVSALTPNSTGLVASTATVTMPILKKNKKNKKKHR